jgi:hypothetical protein
MWRSGEKAKANKMYIFETGMIISPFFSLHQPCDAALIWAKERLSQTGLRPIPTFDLQTARAGLHDCSCPHHGTDECDCQMVVVLVYGDTEQPSTLILHGSDGQTWFSLVDAPSEKANAMTSMFIRNSLNGNSPTAEQDSAVDKLLCGE